MGFCAAADALIGLDEVEGSDEEEEEEEEERAAGAGLGDELPCPFCGEELDAVGLWCHMDDEHHAEANAGVISSRSLMGRCNFYSFLSTRSSSSSRRSVVHPMMFRGTLLGFYFGRVWGMPASLT